MKRLEGKIAIVTGGASGIGRCICQRLASEGAKLLIVDLNAEAAEVAAAAICTDGGMVDVYMGDVCDEQRVNEIVRSCLAMHGRIDILVNNAGGSARLIGKQSNFVDSRSETWKWVLSLNLIAPMLWIHAVLPSMIEQAYGKIINIASIAGARALAGHADYAASKGGVIALSQTVAQEVGKCGININCISPGSIATRDGSPETFLLGAGKPEDVADAVAFLASDDARYITGQNLFVDGGRSITSKC